MSTLTTLPRLMFALILAPALVLLPACGDPQVAAVNETDDRFDVALDAGDGETAVTFLSADSIKWYDQIVKDARTLSKAKTQALPYTHKYMVLEARLLFSKDELKKLDGRGYRARIITISNSGSTSHMRRIKVKISSDRTRAAITYRDPDTRETHLGHYVWENNAWKSDELADIPASDRDARAVAKEQRMTENDLAVLVLGDTWGGEVPDSIWDPKR